MKTILFPAYPAAAGHSVDRGGPAMEVKHTHPQYASQEQRLAKLEEARAASLAAVGKVRGKASDPKALRSA